MKRSKLIGKRAVITDRDSIYYGEWGTIVEYDGTVYYIAIANDHSSIPVFMRYAFKVRREEQ